MEDNHYNFTDNSIKHKLKNIFIGKSRDISNSSTFHKISLIALLAWVGLGADPLTSSCYGPEEAFRNLGTHTSLAIFVGLATALTIFIISTSYIQIIQLFPNGGGGYLVASKLLSPTVGMVSGSALIVDYVLTITLSISSGSDAIFSLLPPEYQPYKLTLAFFGVGVLVFLNLRGVKESVVALTPIFIIFMVLHVFVIGYIIVTHSSGFHEVAAKTTTDVHSTVSQLGIWGTILLIIRAYSMGAGTFTGIEAVSNGMPVLREPRIHTAKVTMRLMAVSLAVIVIGLLVGYSLFDVKIVDGKTLNAVLFENISSGWGGNISQTFVFLILCSEALLLFVAAQAGFLDGPRIMANMANDLWFPKRFASLSDRLVIQNGILLMGAASILLLIISKGSVRLLVVFYSINVFITFSLSQLGMVKHWWEVRKAEKRWKGKLLINGIGLTLTLLILFTVVIIKFKEGGWITILITGSFILISITVKRHYIKIKHKLHVLQTTLLSNKDVQKLMHKQSNENIPIVFNPKGKTALLLVSGYNGTGLHSLHRIMETFGGVYKNFVFIQAGIVDAANSRTPEQIDKLKKDVGINLSKYVKIVNSEGYYGKTVWSMGTDILSTIEEMVPEIVHEFPDSTFFGGQLIFSQSYYLSKILHNHTIFSIQRSLYKKGLTTVILPIYINGDSKN